MGQQSTNFSVAAAVLLALFLVAFRSTSADPLDGIVRNVRCFFGEFYPIVYDGDHTAFTYSIDVLTPRPLELTFERIELGPVEEDRCTWPSGLDSLELHQNGGLLGHWPLTCHDRETLSFGIGSLGADVWGDQPRRPVNGKKVFAPQYGAVDMIYGTITTGDAPSRMRNITIKLFSGSKRAFMPSYSASARYAPLMVRVCLLDSQVPHDVVGTSYAELPLVEPAVWPIASCILEVPGGCMARLGYAANTNGSTPVHWHHGRIGNQLSPSRVENGWTLPSDFVGVHMPSDEPIMLPGWMCYNDDQEEVHWHLGASVLRLDATSRRCAGSASAAAELDHEFGYFVDVVAPLEKNLLKDHTYTVKSDVAQRVWAENNIEQPVLSLRTEK
jgi:hypothetical protein